MDEGIEEHHPKSEKSKTNSTPLITEEDETDELPRKMILCMKKAMQELMTPIEDKLNQLLDTSRYRSNKHWK